MEFVLEFSFLNFKFSSGLVFLVDFVGDQDDFGAIK